MLLYANLNLIMSKVTKVMRFKKTDVIIGHEA
jgi:hypothetical protein